MSVGHLRAVRRNECSSEANPRETKIAENITDNIKKIIIEKNPKADGTAREKKYIKINETSVR